jgi:DNA polymerase I-like protein with 3'-5' exonuclease and polymerase domains
MMRYVIDIETEGLENVKHLWCVVVRCALTGAVLSSTSENDHEESFKLIQEADEVIGHNIINFDLPILRSFGCITSPSCLISDTLVMTRVVWSDLRNDDFKRTGFKKELIGSHSLKAWGVRMGTLKSEFEATSFATWTPEMQNYCEQDTAVTLALYNKIKCANTPQEVFTLETSVAQICKMIEVNGWAFDTAAADQLMAVLLCKKLELKERLVSVFPPQVIQMKTKVKTIPFNPGSRQEIARVLKSMYGWTPTETTPTGQPKIDESVLQDMEYPEAKLLCEYLLIVKRLGQVAEGDESWLKLVKNGRLHGRINTNGAVTGRATHSKPNMSQVPAGRSLYGTECRSLFVPSNNMVLVGADASGLELRCLAHFIARFDDGVYGKIVTDGDIHWENAQAFGLVKAGTKRDKHDPVLEGYRNTSKTLIYAMIYGAGDTKLGSVVGGDDKRGAALRKSFEKNLPAYKMLMQAVTQKAKSGFIIGLDGRRLPIRSPHSALNTLLQSAGAVVMKKALCILTNELTKEGLCFGKAYSIVGWIHDEFQIECKPTVAELIGKAAVKSIRDAGEYYCLRIHLDGEYRQGRSWSETH